MDGSSFDRLARMVGRAVSRRDGLKAALGALGVVATPAVADAARKATRRHEKLACRNAHSECVSNEECCSNRCVPKFGGTGFRCAKAHGRKKGDKKQRDKRPDDICGNPYTCPQCSADDVPACTPNVCDNGCDYSTIGAAWSALPAGSEILVGAGTYAVGLAIDKSMTIRGCDDGVILQNNTSTMFEDDAGAPATLTLQRLALDGQGGTMFYSGGNVSFDVSHCTMTDATTGVYGRVAGSFAHFTCCDFAFGQGNYGFYTSHMSLDLDNCTVSDSYGMLLDESDVTLNCTTLSNLGPNYALYYNCLNCPSGSPAGTVTITNSRIENNTNAYPPVYIFYTESTVMDNVTITGNTRSSGSGGIVYFADGAATMTNVTIAGNTNPSIGTLVVQASAVNTTVDFVCGVSITDNTASDGSGIVALETNDFTVAIPGASLSTVYGNVGGDQRVTGTLVGDPLTPVPDCVYL